QAEEHLALAEEKAARAAAEKASRRLSFLAQASVALASSLDFDAITKELSRLCVPSLADACALTLVAHATDSAGPDVALVAGDPPSMATELAGRAAIALDNARLYEKSQADDRRKDEFLAMLAHELRNPLAPISNAVHVLHMSAQDPAKLTWAREIIGRQLQQL